MATPIKMPQLGVTMTEGTVVSWLKHEGEPVRRGEAVATIETDKLSTEVEASADGVLRRIVAAAGATVPVVGIMGVIGDAAEPESAIDAAAGSPPASAAGGASSGAGTTRAPATPRPVPARAAVTPPATQATAAQPAAPPGPSPVAVAAPAPANRAETEVRASPIARRLAAELGVDLATVRGSGPGGRVVEADVRAAGAALPGSPAAAPVGAPLAAPPEPPEAAADGFVRASPLARRLAREHGLDLHAVAGTGPDGRVVERDVRAAAAAQQAARQRPAAPRAPTLIPAAVAVSAGLTRRETIRLEGMRRVIAERMLQSLQTTAQLTLTAEADATALVELRSHLVPAARVYGHRPPTYTDLLVALVARTLRDHPLLNSSLVGGDAGSPEIACWQEINVGVAVSLERGLVVPVIRQADQQPLQAISDRLGDLAERSRANRLTMDDLEGGTFTITNLGQMEVDGFTPIVNPPQCAILGVGRIARKPAVYQDQVVPRHMVTLSLSFDHRIVDGVPAGAFLRDVKRAVEAASLG